VIKQLSSSLVQRGSHDPIIVKRLRNKIHDFTSAAVLHVERGMVEFAYCRLLAYWNCLLARFAKKGNTTCSAVVTQTFNLFRD
jgi:hypothetical protein